MTDEQIRLYAIARCVVPASSRLRTIAEPAAGGTHYTLNVESAVAHRWFAVHSNVLTDGEIPDRTIAIETERALRRQPARAG